MVRNLCSKDLSAASIKSLTEDIRLLNTAMMGVRIQYRDKFVAFIEEVAREFPLVDLVLWTFRFVVDSTKTEVEYSTIKAVLGCCITLTYGNKGAFSGKAIDDLDFPKKLLSLINYPESSRMAMALVQNLMIDKDQWPGTLLKAGLMFSLAQMMSKTDYPVVMDYGVSLSYIIQTIPQSDALASVVGSSDPDKTNHSHHLR